MVDIAACLRLFNRESMVEVICKMGLTESVK